MFMDPLSREDELKDKENELRKIRLAFLNILEDTEEAKTQAIGEKNKSLAVIKNFTDGLLVLNEDNKIEIISPLVEVFLGQKEEELLGKDVSRLSSRKIDLKPLKEILKVRKTKDIKSIFRKEIRLGEDLFLEVTVSHFKSGEKKGALVILHDVSRDKLVERMKTEFVSISAHQLRTPLSAVKWTLRMILDGDVGEINDEQRDLLEKTYQSNERMIELINDLLNVTRIEEGRFLYKPEPMQIEDVVDQVVGEAENAAKIKKITIKTERPKILLPPVTIDKEKMGIVVQNLLENSLKYTPEGGTVIISLEKKNKDMVFKIADNGVGIPKDQQARIFSKFFRGSNVIKMETEGSGLGLYTVKNIVEAHKGEIWFESKEGEGSTFYFTLPFSS